MRALGVAWCTSPAPQAIRVPSSASTISRPSSSIPIATPAPRSLSTRSPRSASSSWSLPRRRPSPRLATTIVSRSSATRRSASTSALSTGRFARSASDVARPESSSGKSRVWTFMPMPMTTASTFRPVIDVSTRIPASFLCDTRPPRVRSTRTTSFGHFRRMSAPGATPRATPETAIPAAIDRSGSRARGQASRQSTERSRFSPRGETHARPCRPRPAVCVSASQVLPWGEPPLAACFASSFVEVVSSRMCSGLPSAAPRSAMSDAAFARSGAARRCITRSRAPRPRPSPSASARLRR